MLWKISRILLQCCLHTYTLSSVTHNCNKSDVGNLFPRELLRQVPFFRTCIKNRAAPDQLSIPFNNLPCFASRFVNDGAAAVAVLDLDTSRANKLIEAVGAMTTTKSAASETKSKVKLCFSFVFSGAFLNCVDQICAILTHLPSFVDISSFHLDHLEI